MACLEDPPLSFSAAIALPTISLYFGWAAGFLGLAASFYFGDISAIFRF
jgi:hypothetical protein